MKETDNERYARELGCAPSEVENALTGFYENRIVRHVLKDRIRQHVDERRTKLETITPDDLAKTQGEIAGIKAAIAAVLRAPTP